MTTVGLGDIHSRVQTVTLSENSTPTETAAFLSVVLDYTTHMRQVSEKPGTKEQFETEKKTAHRFVSLVTEPQVWSLVQQVASEYRYPM